MEALILVFVILALVGGIALGLGVANLKRQ